MSHAVEPNELAQTASSYDETPYLLYASELGAARANHVRAVPKPGTSQVHVTGFGRGVAKAVGRNAPLSLLWPSPTEGEFSLIADGTGTLIDETNLEIMITSAVLHRPAPEGERNATC